MVLFRDRTLIILTGVLLLAIIIAIGLYALSHNPGSSTMIIPVGQGSIKILLPSFLTQEELSMVNTSLIDETVLIYLNNHTSSVSEVNPSEQYVAFNIENTSGTPEKLLVGVNTVWNTPIYTYLASDPDQDARMINAALHDKFVDQFVINQSYIIRDVDVQNQTVIFGVGAPNYTHQWVIGINITQGMTTYISDLGNVTTTRS